MTMQCALLRKSIPNPWDKGDVRYLDVSYQQRADTVASAMAECNCSSPVECPLCGYLSPTLSLYISHLRLVHSKDDNFRITCRIDECTEVFGAFAALNSHVYRCHRVTLGLERAPQHNIDDQATCSEDTVFEAENEPPDFMNPFHNGCFSTTPSDTLACGPSTPGSSMDISAAKFLLHMREGRQTSQIAISDIIAGCNSLCNQALKEFQAKVRRDIVSIGIDFSLLPSLTDDVNVDLFESVKNNYLFEKFCTEHFGCLVSIFILEHLASYNNILFMIYTGTTRNHPW